METVFLPLAIVESRLHETIFRRDPCRDFEQLIDLSVVQGRYKGLWMLHERKSRRNQYVVLIERLVKLIGRHQV